VAGQQTTGCTAAGTSACKTIQQGVTAADALTGTADTLDVAGSSTAYDEQVTINAPSTDSLDLVGTGTILPTLNDAGAGSDLTIAGTDAGNITIDHFTISGGHSANGGGIDDVGNGETLTIDDSTLSGNSTTSDGGALQDGPSAGNVDITNSTFSGNSALQGGAIDFYGQLTLNFDTLAGNTASSFGGGYERQNNLTNATISNTLLAQNTSGSVGASCAGGGFPIDAGHNVSDDASCGFGSTSVNSSTSVGALVLGANGSTGPMTEAITTSSSAFGEVPASACSLTTDERGDPRPGPGDSACDAGAFEFQPPHGYWLVGSDGGIFSFGQALFHGSTGSLVLNRPVVGITPTSSKAGYWLVASDGGVFAFGDAGFVGSIPGLGLAAAGSTGPGRHLNAPIAGMVPSANGQGYFLVGSDGGVFAFNANFSGSCPAIAGGCAGAAVGVAPDASGAGYWLVTTTGNVYAFGDAQNLGAPGAQSTPITSIVRTPDGGGYWILDAAGSVFSYGDAAYHGGLVAGAATPSNPASAIFTTSDGGGYWVVTANGAVTPFGDAPNDGSVTFKLNGPIIAATGF
jgi:hypothetical protein